MSTITEPVTMIQLTSEQITRLLLSLGEAKSAHESRKHLSKAHEISTLLASIKDQIPIVQETGINGYQFRTAIAQFVPNYAIDQDNYGQIIIYTGMKEVDEDTYVPMTEADFDIDPEMSEE